MKLLFFNSGSKTGVLVMLSEIFQASFQALVIARQTLQDKLPDKIQSL